MIPDVDPTSIKNVGEGLVYRALSKLPPEFIVLHSLPWLRPERDLAGNPLREGEADFVLLHPQEGLLVLEVKGGEPYLEGGTWYRGRGASRQRIKDPFWQAERTMHALLKEVEEKSLGVVRRRNLVHGYAVFFPEAHEQGALPPNAKPQILLNAMALDEPAEAILDAFAAWRSQRRPMSDATFKHVYEAILPRLRLVRTRAPQLTLDGERLVQLTESQNQVLCSLFDNKRVLVEGAAGSGKTLLAYEGAVDSAMRGRRTLLTCYNRHLADWLRERRDADARAERLGGLLDVVHFHKLAHDLCSSGGVQFDASDEPRFWLEEAPMLLIGAVTTLSASGWEPYEAIFVDEGQDFADNWWVALDELVQDKDEGRMYIFMDLHQSLRPEGGALQFKMPVRFPLRANCRNTRWIARTSASLVNADLQSPPLSPLGDEPTLICTTLAATQRGLVEQQVAKLIGEGLNPHQIAVIGPSSLAKGPLQGCISIAGHPLTGEAHEWRQGGSILCTTARAFKGLEADAVVVYDLDRLQHWFTQADLYVACTRAKHILILIAHGGELQARLKDAVAAARRACEA